MRRLHVNMMEHYKKGNVRRLRHRQALEIIAGRRQCADNTMSHQAVAIEALDDEIHN